MEYEIKFSAGAETFEAIRSDPELCAMAQGPREDIPMETHYYRDAEGLLSSGRIMLRLRCEGTRNVVTCKAPSPLRHAREEYELESDSPETAIPRLIDMGAPALLSELKGLEVFCGARFLRQALLLAFENCRAELALDSGFFFREDRKKDFFLLELELKEGSPEAVERLAAILAEKYGLKPEPKSKLEQAMEL